MANATVLSLGGVTVSTTGGLTGGLLNNVINTLGAASTGGSLNVTAVTGGVNNPTLSGPTGSSGTNVLVIPASDTGTIAIPAGYAYVIYQGTGTLTGGTGNVVIGSGLTYSGGAGTVIGTGGTESVTDSVSSAVFSFYSGTASVNATGGSDTVNVDANASANLTVSGTGSTVVLGSGSVTSTSAAFAAATTGSNNVVNVTSASDVVSIAGSNNLIILNNINEVVDATGGAATLVALANSNVSLNATGGSQTIYDLSGGNSYIAGPSTAFIEASTLTALDTYTDAVGGADTVFALSTVNYNGAGAASSLFIGGTGAATVFAGTAATLYGGVGGGTYTEGTGSFFFWGNVYNPASSTVVANDTIIGGAGSASITAYTNTNENLVVSQTGAAGGGFYNLFGKNDTLNLTHAVGSNTVFALDSSIPGLPNGIFTGNSTLTLSNAGSDIVEVAKSFPGFSSSDAQITVNNWQASDTLLLINYSQADLNTLNTALAGAKGAAVSVTLSDNTTIKFVAASPTKAF